ncbi:restriction endonuclease subunit S [Tenacibaculum maritimum]|uniref:restriction endonuclease subunit S n=1 Tax=Tenacibaculum maritimum TaxID=107401 RepID=UPI001E57A39D|nr:restriction endonuclease subunit S [Tenacibaculum maritimum]MCD9621238.1 restriction endonuclease subunit S [Tenacibaculum maritimum]MCD9627783.1 restriction endonuclease subunit S [Tenacibaculum maritimum]MCD9630103.1 restriction endonuclease subunit S [Tenacibaculum maritimum]MCD9633670.1 restriction endonuclease subunit S [Tenacibaculum maritimum]
MELTTKQGFKQTEIGLIPEDWEVVAFDKIGYFLKGKGIKKDEVVSNGNPCIRYGELYTKYDNIIKKTFSFISNEIASTSLKLKYGDLLFAGSGEKREEIGKSAVILRSDTYAGGDIVVFRGRNIEVSYLGYISNSSPVIKQKSLYGQGDAVVHIYSGGLSKIKFPLPPTLKEQKAIATALSDVDDLIASLEDLIAKKQAIKQGAMQQLLIPKEHWVKTCLVELAENKKSRFDDGDWIESEHIISQGVRLIQTGNIGIGSFLDKGNKKYISEESFNQLNCKEVLTGDLLVCRLAEPAGRACIMPNIGEQKVITSVDVSIFRGNESLVSREFLSQIFTTKSWFNKVLEKVGGTTHKRISRGALGKIEIELPQKKEQDKTAKILSDMDGELEQLETKKAKYQQLKQGMLQELLTGNTRLV